MLFNPATQSGGNYFYIVSAAGCGSAYSILTITIGSGPDAGISADSALCYNGDSVDMLGILGGSPDLGGTWTDADGNSVSNLFDPLVDEAGEYFYTVSGAGCPESVATVTMTIDNAANAGTNATSWILL